MTKGISVFTTLNQNYLFQLQVLLTSMKLNNPNEQIELYLLHSAIPDTGLAVVERQCHAYGYSFHPITVGAELFNAAPVSQQYPREMYYRLLAPHILPHTLDRALYLDPDILIINPLRPLWDMDMQGCLFAAAAHTGKTELANNVNRIRLKSENNYYNSGVLLVNLADGRTAVKPNEIFGYIKEHRGGLLLPDQDVLNALYGDRILPLEDAIWNYDARNYSNYLLRSGGKCDSQWVMEHTAILHFCGRAKPWKNNYIYRFGLLYRHYMQLTRRTLCRLEDGAGFESLVSRDSRGDGDTLCCNDRTEVVGWKG